MAEASLDTLLRMQERASRAGAWPVLLAFTFASAVTQLLWLNFAPLISLVVERYRVDEWWAKWLVEAFPLIYIFLSLHAGRLIDRFGCRKVVGRGALATAGFALLRIYDGSFWVLFAAQIGIAVAQPYVTNGVSKLVADWFEERHGAMATGIATMGLFLGMAVAMALTPALVAATSLRTAMVVCAAVAVLAALAVVVLVKDPPAASDAPSARPQTLRQLLRSRDLVIVLILGFLGLGIFNGLMTWLELLLKPQGIDAEQAGLIGGALIVGGIFGAAAIPALSDAAQRRKPFVVACTAVAVPLIFPLCRGSHVPTLLGLAAAFGFFFLPAYALLLEMCSELAGHASAGYATGLLMLAGNAGGVLIIEGMHATMGADGHHGAAIGLMLGAGVIALTLALRVSETFHARRSAVTELADPRGTARRR